MAPFAALRVTPEVQACRRSAVLVALRPPIARDGLPPRNSKCSSLIRRSPSGSRVRSDATAAAGGRWRWRLPPTRLEGGIEGGILGPKPGLTNGAFHVSAFDIPPPRSCARSGLWARAIEGAAPLLGLAARGYFCRLRRRSQVVRQRSAKPLPPVRFHRRLSTARTRRPPPGGPFPFREAAEPHGSREPMTSISEESGSFRTRTLAAPRLASFREFLETEAGGACRSADRDGDGAGLGQQPVGRELPSLVDHRSVDLARQPAPGPRPRALGERRADDPVLPRHRPRGPAGVRPRRAARAAPGRAPAHRGVGRDGRSRAALPEPQSRRRGGAGMGRW